MMVTDILQTESSEVFNMPKLPVCPHCHTIYRYDDVRKLIFEKEHTCYHCDKNFRISKKNVLILFLIIEIIASALNVFELYMMADFMVLIITNIISLLIGIILVPYFLKMIK